MLAGFRYFVVDPLPEPMPLELPVLPELEEPVDGLALDGLLELDVPPLLEVEPLSRRQRSFSAPVSDAHWVADELPEAPLLGDEVDEPLLVDGDAGEVPLTPDPDDWANEAAESANSAAAVAILSAFNIVSSPI